MIHYERSGLVHEVLQLASLSDGSIIATGAFRKGMFSFDEATTSTEEFEAFYVARIASGGEVQWLKSFASTGCIGDCDRVFDLSVDEADNIYLGGYFNQKLSLDGITLEGGGNAEAFYAVLTADGTVLSAQEFPGPINQYTEEIAVAEGGLIIAGAYDGDFDFAGQSAPSAPEGQWNSFIGKFGGDEKIQWALFGDSAGKTSITAIAAAADGSVVIGGNFGVGLTLGGIELDALGQSDGFFAKISSDGEVVWLRRIGTLGDFQYVFDLKIDADNNIWVSGACSSVIEVLPVSIVCGKNSGYVLKAEPEQGVGLWGVAFNGPPSDIGISANHISITPAGRGLVLGRYAGFVEIGDDMHNSNGASDVYIAELSSDGDVLWSQSIGGNNAEVIVEFSSDLVALGDHAFALAGVFYGSVGLGDFPTDFADQTHNVFLHASY